MGQVHTGAYVSLLAPGKTDYTACHPRKTTTYILHVVPITKRTYDRHRSIGEKETKKRKEDIVQEKTDKTIKRKIEKERKDKTRKAKKDKTRRGSKERKRERVPY